MILLAHTCTIFQDIAIINVYLCLEGKVNIISILVDLSFAYEI